MSETLKNLTYEQQEVLASLNQRDRIKVFALAGTGKTFTLQAIAKLHPHQNILYLAFNRGIADKARGKFPPNVEVRTVHSLAYSNLGKFYRNRLSRLDYFQVAEALRMPIESVFQNIRYFHAFLNSGCPLVQSQIWALISSHGSHADPEQIAEFIIRLFHGLKHGDLQVDHSFYLKDFQLNFQSCGLDEAYDMVLLDEGQDVNPVILSIFEQFRARKIMVGDRHQKIYGFRGAINALEEFVAEETLYLTRTFRFHGQDQVNAVNNLLFHLKCEDNLIEPVDIDLSDGNPSSCVITRSNSKLMETLLENPDLKTVRHPKEYFDRFFNVFDRKIRVPSAGRKTFPGYLKSIEEMAETVGDQDLLGCVRLIKRYYCDPLIFQSLYQKALKNYGNGAQTYLGTAHSVKGLEFDTVRLTEDFKSPGDLLERLVLENPALCRPFINGSRDSVMIQRSKLRGIFSQLHDDLLKEEINLLYVALTRAKKEIEFPHKYLIYEKYAVDIPDAYRSVSMVAFGNEQLF